MSDTRDSSGLPRVEAVEYAADGTKTVESLAPGTDITEVERRLRAEGRRLGLARILPGRRRPAGVSAEDFARFNELLASAVDRGVPLPDGLRRLAAEFRNGRFRLLLERVAARLSGGASLKDAFAPERDGIPALYGRLLEAGAASGDLGGILLMLGRNIRADAEFRRGVIEACVYPALLLAVSCALLAGFAGGVLPQIEGIAPRVSVQVPWLTRLVVASNLYLQVAGTVLVLLAGAAALAALRREAVLRRLPFFNGFHEAALWANAADTLALLVRAEVPALAALRLIGAASGSPWLARTLDRLAVRTEAGRSLSDAGREDLEVPAAFTYALDAGERRGDLCAAMSDLAERYRSDARRRARFLIRYLPPAFAVLFGFVVFLIAMALLPPYFRFWGAPW